MASFTFTGPGGVRATQRMDTLVKSSRITTGDCLMAGQILRSLIIQRTQQKGIDVNGSTFAPYSTKGPYYYYPQKTGGRTARIKAAALLARRIGASRSGSRTPRPWGEAKGGMGLKFDSYAAFKRSLGRGNVDLTGPKAPHMMQAISVRANGASVQPSQNLNIAASGSATPSNGFEIGFYGPEAGRAKGNNEGAGKLPARRFFANSQADLKVAMGIIAGRIKQRRDSQRG